MPHVRVTVDGQVLASVATDALEIIVARVGGTRTDDDYADLGLTGGVYSADGGSDHRIWINQTVLKRGQSVEVALLEEDMPVGSGRTIEEIYPASETSREQPPVDMAELCAEERRAPLVRDRYVLEFTTPTGTAGRDISLPDEHGFGFSVYWSSQHPSRAAVKLYAYTIDSMERRESGRTIFRENMTVGTSARLELAG
jgi:hypothetical protein